MNATAKLQNFIILRPLLRLRLGYFRSFEITALVIALFAIIAVCHLFFNVLGERRQNIDSLQSESQKLHTQIDQFRKQEREARERANNTKLVLEKLDEFNNRFLKDQRPGRLAIIDELNELIRNNGLLLQSGLSFRQIVDVDEVDQKEKIPAGKKRRSKSDKIDVFPGMQIGFSVSGPYENFRKFLYDLETNKLFMIVERIDLRMNEGQQIVRSQQSFGRQPRNVNVPGRDAASGLQIQISLKTYFRKQVNVAN
jgi:hypothetical protein